MREPRVEGLQPPDRRALVSAPEILRALVTKDLKVKYKRSILGFAWSLMTPVALTGVYLFVFIHVYRVPEKDFVLFLLAGLLPWNFFNISILAATSSVVDNGPLIRKVYFPRALLPVSSVTANLINFLIGLALLVVVMGVSGRPVWLTLHWLVLAVALETALCIGVALALSVWNVYFRDIQQLIGIFLLILFFATPIVYDVSRVPDAFRPLILANPLSTIMQTYRAALFHARSPDLGLVALGLAETLAIFLLGFLEFRRLAPRLAKEV